MVRRLRGPYFQILLLAVFASVTATAWGQAGGGGGGGGGGNGGNGGGNTGGIEIDANGVLHQRSFTDTSGQLDRQRAMAARSALSRDLQTPSKMRMVSLNRLEAEIKRLKDESQPLPPDMQFLAGLTRITHVFYYPESKDIVIAGPAEGFYLNSRNRIVGLSTGASTLQLEDLIVALRAFQPGGQRASLISCSIDPTQEGLARMKEAVKEVQAKFRPGLEQEVAEYFRQALGMQEITIKGISPNTHFARVMVEADYTMKLIGIGLLQTPVRITSFIERANPTTSSNNGLQRWYFQPNYECVKVTTDGMGMQLDGSGVKLVGEDERVDEQGNRKSTGGSSRASQAFCSSFTKNYDELARHMPLYGELRNLVDMSIVAAFIHQQDYYGQSGWNMDLFRSETDMPVEKLDAPKLVAPVVNSVWKNGLNMWPIGGGVNIQPRAALKSEAIAVDESGKIGEARDQNNKVQELAANQWWWDGAEK